MVSTRLSLLQHAREGDNIAWEQFSKAYQPLISWWLRRHKMKPQDIDEISQEVMLIVLRKIGEFKHSGNVGAFRCWLRTITANQLRAFARKNFKHRHPSLDFDQSIDELKDDSSELSKLWDQQYDQNIIKSLLEWISENIDPKTVEVFQKLVFEEIPAAQVATELGISVGSVYSAKSRVMRKIRKFGSGLIDDANLD